MGFSVSGAAVIVFAGLFIAFSMFYGASWNSFERVDRATESQNDQRLAEDNTAVDIKLVEHRDGHLIVLINNTGSTSLGVGSTDLLIDNQYESGWESGATVNGDAGTDLWLPGEQLNITVERSTAPDRVKVVTEYGVEAIETEVV